MSDEASVTYSFVESAIVPCFVPVLRPELKAKAFAAGADVVIFDLEDGVAEADKEAARSRLAGLQLEYESVMVRVNATDSPHFLPDIDAVRSSGARAVMLAKAESGADIRRVRGLLPETEVAALVETARGLQNAGELLRAGAVRLVFGSIDYAVDIGAAHSRDALLLARARLVHLSRLEGAVAPIDGVTTDFQDLSVAEDDMRYAAGLGFSGKLSIHPAQIPAILRGAAPAADEIAWARGVIAFEEAASSAGAVNMNGTMIDRPVRLRARRVIQQFERTNKINP